MIMVLIFFLFTGEWSVSVMEKESLIKQCNFICKRVASISLVLVKPSGSIIGSIQSQDVSLATDVGFIVILRGRKNQERAECNPFDLFTQPAMVKKVNKLCSGNHFRMGRICILLPFL